MPDLRSPRSGASRLLVAVAVCAVFLLALLSWLLFSRGEPDAADAGAGLATPSAPIEMLAPEVESEAIDRARVSTQRPIFSNEGFVVQPGVRLSGPGVLTGRVLERSSGAPVAGTGVELLPLPPIATEFFGRVLRLANTGEGYASRVEPIAVAVSGADGSFSFEGVYTGTYYIQARGARHVPDNVARAFVAASGAGGPVELFVRPGGRVLGVVLRPDGRPATGVQVALTLGPGLAIESARSGDACYLEARTDGEGSFVIAGVPPGKGYDVTASGAGFALSHALDIDVRAGEDTTVVVRTRNGGSIEGRVVARPAVGDEKSTPRPLAGAHVAVVPRGLRSLQFAEEVLHSTHAICDSDGRFRITGAPPGELDLVGVADGCLPAKGPRVVCADGALATAEDFELPRGPLVSGRLVDSSGAPIEGATVRWNPVDFRNFEFDFSFAPLLAASVEGFDYPRTDAEGRFTAGAFAGKPPHRLDFFKLGYAPARHEWDPAKETGEIEVVMRAGAAIEGIVMDLARKAPVTSFQIQTRDRVETLIDAPGNNNPFSSGIVFETQDGRFRLDPVKSGDKVSFTVKARGYLDAEVADLTVAEGETRRGVIVELEPGGRIVGAVVDAEGRPIAGAQVFAVPADRAESFERRERGRRRGAPRVELEQIPPGFRDFAAQLGLLGDRAVQSDADGAFELVGVEPGATVVLASHRDYVIGRSDPIVVAATEEPNEVEIELGKGGGVFGRALDRFDRPVAGAIVIAASPANFAGEGRSNGGALYQGRTDAAGEYRIERMAAGGYFLLLTRGDEALNPMSFLGTLNFDLVTVPGDEMVEYDIRDTSSGATRVYGRVLDGDKPVSRGAITAMSFESESMLGIDLKIAQIGADGAYEFAGLPPGEVRFNIDASDRRGTQVTAQIPDAPEHRLDLRLPEGAIEGRIVDSLAGTPISGARVTARRTQAEEASGWLGSMVARESGMQRASSDDDGVFRVTRLDAGVYQLTVTPPRREEGAGGPRYASSQPLEIELRADEVRGGVEIALAPAVELAGRVLDESGAPVDDARLIATRTDVEGAPPESTSSDKDGSYRFSSLAAGRYEISASAEGYADTLLVDVEVSAARATPFDITVARGVDVTVKVTSAGRPVTGATGRLVRIERGAGLAGADFGRTLTNLFAGKGVSDSSGVLELGVHAPGEYRLEVQRGLERVEERVQIDATDKIELRVRLK